MVVQQMSLTCKRDLSQGDSLSSILFLIGVDVLNFMFNSSSEVGFLGSCMRFRYRVLRDFEMDFYEVVNWVDEILSKD